MVHSGKFKVNSAVSANRKTLSRQQKLAVSGCVELRCSESRDN